MVISASELANLLNRRLAEHKERATLFLVQGSASGFPEYTEHVGYLRALREVSDYLDEITRKQGNT